MKYFEDTLMNNKSESPTWWRIFAVEYIRNGENGAAAYRKAKNHVSNKTAEVESCKLLKNPEFSEVFEEERKQFNKTLDLSREQWIKELVEIATSKPEKVEAGAKLRALELLGKAKGFLVERVEAVLSKKTDNEKALDILHSCKLAAEQYPKEMKAFAESIDAEALSKVELED